MKCPKCQTETGVRETREGATKDGDYVRRRRVCPACRFTFATYEQALLPGQCAHCGKPFRAAVLRYTGLRRRWCTAPACLADKRAWERAAVQAAQQAHEEQE